MKIKNLCTHCSYLFLHVDSDCSYLWLLGLNQYHWQIVQLLLDCSMSFGSPRNDKLDQTKSYVGTTKSKLSPHACTSMSNMSPHSGRSRSKEDKPELCVCFYPT